MTPRWPVPVTAMCCALAACSVVPEEIGRAPALSPVGAGLRADHIAVAAHEPMARTPERYHGSTWRDATGFLYRDARALKIGDVVTVKIAMKDRASLDNSSNRSRDSKSGLSATLGYALDLFGINKSGSGDSNLDVQGSSSSQGKGAISRSEKIDMMVAAVVTDVLPNGNFLISGTQEVQVNFEVRVLSVSGIVRPRDLGSDNTISYERIAEARIAYGGRGRLMEVQQPAVGQQIYDIVTPF